MDVCVGGRECPLSVAIVFFQSFSPTLNFFLSESADAGEIIRYNRILHLSVFCEPYAGLSLLKLRA